MKQFSIWRFLLAVVAFAVISQIVHTADGIFGMNFYTDPAYAPVWSKYMMPEAGPPPASFFYMSAAFNLIGAIIFVGVYAILKNAMPGKSPSSKGFIYGLLAFLLSGIPGMLAMILIINLPLTLILLWTAEDLAIKLLGGISSGAINK